MGTPVRICSAVVLALLLIAPAAHAQAYIAPSLGITVTDASDAARASVGTDVGWLAPRDPFGAELAVVYVPGFFGSGGRYGDYGDNSLTTVMLNVMLAGGDSGGPRGFGGRRGGLASVRPYVSAGIGVIHEVSTVRSAPRVANDDLGANIGVGVLGFVRRSAGVRADLRYFRNIVATQTADRGTIAFGGFHLWRASLGLVFGF